MILANGPLKSGTHLLMAHLSRLGLKRAPGWLANWDVALTVSTDHRVRVAAALSGGSARELLEGLDGCAVRLPVDRRLYPDPAHLRWHHGQVFQGRV